MKIFFILRLSLINTFKKRLRAALAIGGIALTTSVMVALLGIDMGLRALVQQEINNNEHQEVVTVSQRGDQQIKFDEESVSKIRSISGVGQVGQAAGLVGTIAFGNANLTSPLYAVTDNYFNLSSANPTSGSIDSFSMGENAVVSKKVLDVFGISAKDAIGKTFTLSATIGKSSLRSGEAKDVQTDPIKYTIKATIDRGDRPIIYIPLEKMKTAGLVNVDQLKVRVNTPQKVPEVREAIERKGFETASILDMIEQANRLFDVIRNVLHVFGVVVFAVTVSSTFTIISLTLMQETRQIGFLRINGFLNKDVKALFLLESITLTLMGALLGVTLGIVGGLGLNGVARSIAKDEAFTTDVSIFMVPFAYVIIILMISVGIGWIVGLIPAKRAVLIQPLQELNG